MYFECEQFIDLLGSIMSLLSVGITVRDQIAIGIVVIVAFFDTEFLVSVEVDTIKVTRCDESLSVTWANSKIDDAP